MNRYDDIIDRPHHTSPIRRPMPTAARAAQFAPFAALEGHEKAISDTARVSAANLPGSRPSGPGSRFFTTYI